MTDKAKLIELLEPLINANGAREVLFAFASTCNEKAEHCRANWQDERTAKVWDRIARRVGKVAGETAF